MNKGKAASIPTAELNQPLAAGGTARRLLPYLALISGILALSLSALFVHWAEAPGTITALYRMVFASLGMLPFLLRRPAGQRLPAKKYLLLPALGGLFVALDHGFWSTSIGMTQVGTATLINNIAPLWVALFSVLFLHERLSGRFWIGLALTLAGVTVVFGSDLLLQPHFGSGDVLALFSSVFYGGYYLITQRAREHADTLSYTWMVTTGGAFFLLIANLAMGKPLSGYSTTTWLVFLGAGLISQIIGYFSVVYALGHLPAFVVAPTMISQPVLTALMAIPLAGQVLLPGQWLGGVAVLTGVYLINRARDQQPPVPE